MPPTGLKICIVGQNASMKFGGEASLPWLCFKFLRQRGVDAHLVVHARTRAEVMEGFPQDQDRLHFSPETRLDRALWRAGSFLPAKIDAQTFGTMRHIHNQRLQRHIVRRLIANEGIQIVHEINPVSPKQISLMHGLGVPVVIGPLAGGMLFPPAFAYMEPFGARTVESLGRGISHLLNRIVPGKSQADVLIVANDQARAALPRGVRGTIVQIPDVGVDLSVWTDDAATSRMSANDGKTRFVYLGRLADWKGVNFLIDAFAIVARKSPGAELAILGDGQERRALEEQSKQLGLTDRINFAGWVSAEQGAARLQDADVFVLPSLHEVGGIVLLEAMAVGLPVIATDWGGPAVHVSDETGIRVKPDSKEGFVNGLAEAMLKLSSSPELRASMSAAAIQRVKTNLYDWNQKTDKLLEIYEALLMHPENKQSASR